MKSVNNFKQKYKYLKLLFQFVLVIKMKIPIS